jgi:hypothetical protein
VTTWPARRVGDRVLCGRPTPIGPCIGEIATLATDGARFTEVVLPTGLTEDPPGSGRWRLTARARRQREAGRTPAGEPNRLERDAGWSTAEGRLRLGRLRAGDRQRFLVPCPVCGVLSEVSTDLLA